MLDYSKLMQIVWAEVVRIVPSFILLELLLHTRSILSICGTLHVTLLCLKLPFVDLRETAFVFVLKGSTSERKLTL